MKYVAAAFAILFSISCSKDNAGDNAGSSGSGNPPPGTKVFSGGTGSVVNVEFDSSVLSSQVTSINQDMANIAHLNLSSPPTGQNASYFGVASFDGNSLSNWLRERVKYIIGEYYSDSSVTYSSPSTFNVVLSDSEMNPFVQAQTVMQNTGTGYWLTGKKYSRLYKMPINSKTVEVRGPRVGVIQIGEALFSSSYETSSKGRDAVVNSLRRISTYFHEARHSDGNGTHAGFPHAKCTEGSYYGEYACEQFSNGPYVLQSELLDSFYRSCGGGDCDSSDLETLRLLAADKKSRLIGSASYKDPAPERLQ